MPFPDPLVEQGHQGRVVNSKHFSRWGLDIDREVCRVGKKRSYTGRDALRFGQIRRFRSAVRMAEPRAVQQHLFLLAPRQIGETFGPSGTPESEEAVAVHACKPNERLLQFLAAHALDRIAPEAVYFSDDT